MRIYVKLLIIFDVLAYCKSYTYPPNVGSVLFSPSDVGKERWTRSELEALQARKYFQNLIPAPDISNTMNNDYLKNLLNYFENCYSMIDKEANSYTEQEVMDMALSDAIGGYIKVWVLPITKYAYYGGTISSDNAIKVFQLYGNIKRSLNTDGRSWHGPNEDLLRSVTIDIAPNPHEWYPRSTHNACDRLAYYEKTDNGLTIPLPYINWDISPQTMFIPIKNQPLIQLMSPNSSTSLLDYYITAASCVNSNNFVSSNNYDDFGPRFQVWLTSDVVPHLRDDNLYVAFGSVLALMNKTKSFYKDVVNFCDDKYIFLQNKALAAGCPISWTSRKVFIIAILLFLEIIWCIPALCCFWTHKKKSKIQKYLPCFKRKPKHNLIYPLSHSKDKHLFPGVKLFLKPRTRNLEVDVEFPSCGPKYVTVKSLKTSKENVTHINEISKTSSPGNKMSTYKNPFPSLENNVISNHHTRDSAAIRGILKESKYSQSMPLLKDSTKTMTLLQEHEIKNISYTHANVSVSKSLCQCLSVTTENDKKTSTRDYDTNPSISDNKRKDGSSIIVKQKIKESLHERSNKSLTRSENKSRSKCLRTKDISLNKISEPKNEKQICNKVLDNRSIKKDQFQSSTAKKSDTMSIARSNKSKECAEKRQSNVSKVPKIIKPKKENIIEEDINVNSTINRKKDNLIETRKKSRFPKIFRPTNIIKSDEKEDITSQDYSTLNIKIYNTQNETLKRSSKISKPSQETSKKLVDEDYHTFNIDIDHPQTDIEVDITSYRSSRAKPSKIPRRIVFKANSINSSEKSGTPNKEFPDTIKTLCKTIKTTLDDSAIQKVEKKNDKLNTTL